VLSAQLSAEYGKGEYQAAGGDFTEKRFAFALDWQFARTLALSLSYDHDQRESDSTVNQYRENRFWLTVRYQRGSPHDSLDSGDFAGAGGE
jgi:hypothetical protein